MKEISYCDKVNIAKIRNRTLRLTTSLWLLAIRNNIVNSKFVDMVTLEKFIREATGFSKRTCYDYAQSLYTVGVSLGLF